MAIQATFDSVCEYCEEDIEEGDMISKREGWGWVHDDGPGNSCAEEIDKEDSKDSLKGTGWDVN